MVPWFGPFELSTAIELHENWKHSTWSALVPEAPFCSLFISQLPAPVTLVQVIFGTSVSANVPSKRTL